MSTPFGGAASVSSAGAGNPANRAGGYLDTGSAKPLGGGGGLRTPGGACSMPDGTAGTWELGANRAWRCVAKAAPAQQQFLTPGSVQVPTTGATTPTATKPAAPAAPGVERPREIGGSIPELQKLGGDYQTHLRNLESGAGYSMDVLTGAQRNQTEAQIKQAREAAAANGVPFDEERMRSELQRGVYSAQAAEKLGREKMLTDAYGQAPGIIGADEAARQGRWKIGAGSDVATNAANAAIYGTNASIYGSQAGMYNTEVNAANAANQALLDFISRIYSGMFNVMGGSMSQNYTYG